MGDPLTVHPAEPPQPVLFPQPATSNTFQLNVGNSLDLLTYQLYQSSALSAGMSWNLLATGSRGQTNFVVSSTLGQAFFRAGVLTNY